MISQSINQSQQNKQQWLIDLVIESLRSTNYVSDSLTQSVSHWLTEWLTEHWYKIKHKLKHKTKSIKI